MNKLEKRIEEIKELLRIQKQSLKDNYMIGLYNGLELAVAILEDRKPSYQDTIK